MEPTLIQEDKARIWNEFVINSNLSHIFQSFEWGEFKSNFGWEPIRIAFQENGKIKAALQILRRKIPLTKKSFFYIPRGPILDYKDDEVLAFVLNFIKRYSKEEHVVIVKISPDISNEDHEVKSTFEKSKFYLSKIQLQHKCTYRIDLSEELEDILAKMESRNRYALRKAERDGVETAEAGDISVFFDLYEEMNKQKKTHYSSKEYFLKIQDFLVPRRLAKVFIASYKGEVVAGAVIFMFGKKLWYMYGATSLKHRNINSGHLLHWRIIQWAKENNFSWYDLQGIPEKVDESDPLWGIYLFKRGFGGKRFDLIGEHDLVLSKPFMLLWHLYSKRLR